MKNGLGGISIGALHVTPLSVERENAIQIELREPFRRERAGAHGRLELGNGEFVELRRC